MSVVEFGGTIQNAAENKEIQAIGNSVIDDAPGVKRTRDLKKRGVSLFYLDLRGL